MIRIGKRLWTPNQISEIINLYTKRGWTIREIAHKYATKAEKISKILHDNNIDIRYRKINKCINEGYFDEIDNKAKAYFLGLMLADGSISKDPKGERQPSVRLELVETDKDILDKFKTELHIDSELSYSKKKNRKNGTFSLNVRSKMLATALEQYGVCSNKTYILSELPIVDSELIPHLIRGLIDGDGSIYYSQNIWHVNFTGYSYEWVYSFMETVCDLIGKERRLAITHYNGVHKVTFNGKDALKVIMAVKYLDSDCFSIERKRSLAIRAYENNVGKDIVCTA